MDIFGLDSASVVARVKSAGLMPRMLTLQQSVLTGSCGFALIGLGSFSLWAFGGQWLEARVGELGLYAACAAVLIGGGGGVFSLLVIGPARLRRFYQLFALAFFLYAGVWTGSFFSMRSKSGEWLASLLGPAIMGMTFANAFGAAMVVRKVAGILIAAHSLGYFAGRFLYSAFPFPTGPLLWGAVYGLGFGAGIGYALYACQEPTRKRLTKTSNIEH